MADVLAPPEEDAEDEESATTPAAAPTLEDLLAAAEAAGEKVCDDPRAAQVLSAAFETARQFYDDDGALDERRLRKAGRLKVVVPNPKDAPPTAAQRDQWRAFLAGGAALDDEAAAAILRLYESQRPERVRWYRRIYQEPEDSLLPAVGTPSEMRRHVLPAEAFVYETAPGRAAVAVVFDALWCREQLAVHVRDRKVLRADRVRRDSGNSYNVWDDPESNGLDSAASGRLRPPRHPREPWAGVFHSDLLRGYREASRQRYKYATDPSRRRHGYRPLPDWEVITGDYPLAVHTGDGAAPSPEQESAFRAFNADPRRTADVVLSALFEFYQRIRPGYVDAMSGDEKEVASVLPEVRSHAELLDFIELTSVTVHLPPTAEETSGPRTVHLPFGPEGGHEVVIPPKNPGVAIGLNFAWEDEHGLGVLWRNGVIEKVGDAEAAWD